MSRLSIALLLSALMAACSDQSKPATAALKTGTTAPPGIQAEKPETAKITVTVVSPAERQQAQEHRAALQAEVDRMEHSMRNTITAYDKSLSDSSTRKKLEAQMQAQSARYKQKVLELVADNLKTAK